jgi:hypothetical protein
MTVIHLRLLRYTRNDENTQQVSAYAISQHNDMLICIVSRAQLKNKNCVRDAKGGEAGTALNEA